MGRHFLLAAAAAFTLSGGLAQAAAPDNIAAAVADTHRPPEDSKRDADRKPAEMLAYARVKPGEKVADFLPGGGYFTRLFSTAVGPKGHVYAIIGEQQAKATPPPAVNAIAADPAYANVTVVAANFTSLKLPEPVDLIWTSQNYHDLHLKRFNLDVAAVNKAVFNALKPGGAYVVLDHAALPGSPLETADSLHRIDPALVRSELEAAGFKYEGESSVLRNPADPKTAAAHDPSIRGHTDQFIYTFRKPK